MIWARAKKMHILLVEDNKDIAASIGEYLEFQGYICDFASDGRQGLNLAENGDYDLYVFDVGMPGMNGLQLCQTLREQKQDARPVLFLTARDTLDDKLAGFAAGGDDYLVKPFELQELHARLQALGRRALGGDKRRLQLADLSVNLDTQEVVRAGCSLDLSPNNYTLLVTLLQHAPKVVSRRQLEEAVWGDGVPDSDSLRSHIYKLRQQVDKPFASPLIHTVQGRGFRLAEKLDK